MSLPLPDPQFGEEPSPAPPQNPWTIVDLVVFVVFFLFTVFLLNVTVIRFWGRDLTALTQVVLQSIMDGMLVGFIAFLIKVVHRQPFLQTIHWFRNHQFGTGFLISLGATLAISVLIVSSFFPAGEAPPIEKLLSSTSAVYVFALFGIGAAPFFEEVIFRGFLFKVLFEVRWAATAVLVILGLLALALSLFALLFGPQLWRSSSPVALSFIVGCVVGYFLSLVRGSSNSQGSLFKVLLSVRVILLALLVGLQFWRGSSPAVLSFVAGSVLGFSLARVRWPAAVSVTAILFALLHIPQLWGSWAGVTLIFVVGYVLSWVRWRSNSLIPSFIIHTSYNAMLFGVFAVSTLVQKGHVN